MKRFVTLILISHFNFTIMAKEIKTEILINSSPEIVWAVLTNFDDYPNWNPFIKSIKGEAKVGKKITARIEPPDAKGMTFKPKILVFDQNKELRWLGNLLFAGLFDGEHKFELIDNKNGTTTFIQSEKFKGIFVPMFKKMLEINTKKGFEEMNEKLKQVAEKKVL